MTARRQAGTLSFALALVAAAVGGGAHASQLISLEYPEPYKSPRALGMGGADAAVGGHADALFTNPAGLAGQPRGWHLAPARLTLASSRRTQRFVRRLSDALDIDDVDPQREALVEVLRDHRGQNMHGEGTVLPTFSWRGDRFAAALGWLGTAKLDGRARQGFGEHGLLDVDARTLTGVVAGMAYTVERVRLGMTLKSLRRNRVSRSYSIRELIELSQEDRSITDDRQAGRDMALDAGLQLELAPANHFQPRLGLVIHNLGGLDFGPAGIFPRTVTAGVSLRPPLRARQQALTLSLEYFDALRRLPQDRSHGKRLRAGAEWRLWERRRSSLKLRAGLYQTLPTAGLDYRLRWFRVGFATYAEEQGAHPGQDPDRRYVLELGVEL